MSQKALFDKLKKSGFYRTLNITFPVRKETSDTAEELRLMVGRKISFDLGIANLRVMGSFDIFSTNINSPCSSGVSVMKIAKSADDMTWLRLGERCYDLKLKLGESRTTATAIGNILQQKDYSKVTQTSIQEKLPKFVGFIKQSRIGALNSSEDSNELRQLGSTAAICHDLVLKRFEPPLVKLQIRCGAGFRVESFVNDLAAELDTVAHITDMHCYRRGPFTYDDALPSYAISWDACRKTSDKYQQELLAYNHKVKQSFSHKELELFLSEKLLYRLSNNDKVLRAKLKSSNRTSGQPE